jgi:hypothetical protein
MDEQQFERFGEAVEQKKEEAKRRSEQPRPAARDGEVSQDEQDPLVEPGRAQDVRDERAKSSGHGKKTADKWNQ